MNSVLRGMKSTANYVNELNDSEGDTVTVRPSATAVLAIDSDDRYPNYRVRRTNPTYPFSINIQKNENILNGFFRRLALTEFRLNWTLPNISQVWGNSVIELAYVLTANISSSPPTVTLIVVPDGFYGAEELANQLQKNMREQTGNLNWKVITKNEDDDVLSFIAPTGYSFFFSDLATNERELCDLMNVPVFPITIVGPSPATNYSVVVNSGVPNLRPMDYFDLVCSELSYNQNLKDTTSAPIYRDMITRIYLDDSVASQSLVTTNYFTNTATTTTITGYPTGATVDDEFTYTVGTTAGFTVGSSATISGFTNGLTWNGDVEIIGITGISGGTIQVLYNDTPGALPTIGAGSISARGITQHSTPVTTWDDRVNGVTPFVIYRQFPYPKQIRWNKSMPIGNMKFEMYDDQGRNIQDLWNRVYPPTTQTGLAYANSFVWNATILVSED